MRASLKKTYGGGLVLIVDDSLNVEVWLDDAQIINGGARLDSLDQFMRLREMLMDVDDVAVLTRYEADEVSLMVAANDA